ncbi:MAG TPA: AAA family ATPase [Acetobacteraceae bacterium]|nr:AAA family ATPase [Acetobacteraceae bacterium]
MRFRRLLLERYGHFTGAALDLPPAARLHVVLGANEAGKTTALAAIGDLLFGFETRSRFGFLHDQASLRVGAELEAGDGVPLAILRRKGRGQTLTSPDGAPVAEAQLAALMGGVGRGAFETMFGLDGTRLRAGGDELLRGGASLGVTLFQAAAGIQGVASLAAELEAEADQDFAMRRGSKRTFYIALDQYDEADKRRRQHEVRPESWREARDRLDAAQAALDSGLARHAELERLRLRLERIVRLAPRLRAIAADEAALAEVAGAPPLPPDARAVWQDACRQRQSAGQALHDAHAELARIVAALAGLAESGTLAPLREEIEALQARRGAIAKALGDLPGLRDEAAAEVRAIVQAVASLGLDLTAEDAAGCLPAATARTAVQRLAGSYGSLRQRLADAEAGRDAAIRALAAAEVAAQALPPEGDVAVLGGVVARLRRAGDLEAPLATATRAADAAAARAAAALSALRLWSDDAASLAALELPGEATVRRHARLLDAAEKEAIRRREAVADLAARRQAADRHASALAGAADLATAETVAALRRSRDAGWEHLRRIHLLPGIAAPEALVDAHAELVAAADREADRRLAAGERAAALELARQEAEARATELAAAKTASRLATDALAAAEADWRSAWAPAGIVPLPPAEMERWLADRARVLDLHAQADAARETAAAKRDGAASARAEFAALLQPAPDEPLGLLIARAEAVVAAEDAAQRARQAATDALDRTRAACAETADAGAAATREMAAWQARWIPALAAAGLPAGLAPEDAADALGWWQEIATHAAALAKLRARIAAIERDDAAFRADVAQRAAVLAPDLRDGDSFAVVLELQARLARELTDDARRQDLARQEEAAHTAERRATEAIGHAGAALDRLRDAAGVDAEDALEPAIARAERRADLLRRIAEAREAALALAEGQPLAALAEAAEGADLDALRAQIETHAAEAQEIMARREGQGAERRDAEELLARLGGVSGAAEAAQQRHDAAAAMGASLQRYARLHVAARLLRHGIDRFRQRQQGPLLTRGGAHFAALTAGRYDRLLVGYGAGDEPELQVGRADGAELGVAALSEGTRDQLYLALRVAAIETYAVSAEPLPLIGDDLLVHFDDTRAAAALRLLAGLGERMQTILFTHHHHLAELARAEIAGDRLAIHVLPGP